ncbi:energy-coupling factor transporter transmembrane component T [Actinomyces sp. ZJ308]|uniref:energy-coupling factor transporter transmembrane component T n=1 Tax=Actinomyces sp. ZJ308 TaxID=2708342 RepID=UPI001423768C|nr:energy-coupling factor transporter transmembrane component T [Actinomyces sp. ZJ308]
MRAASPGRGGLTGGLVLDPRTKLLVVVVVSWVLLSTSGGESGSVMVVRWLLIALPFLLLVLSRIYGLALRYAITYAALAGLPLLIWRVIPASNALIDITLTWLGALSIIVPGMTCGLYALRTTTASEFLVAMQRIHCPDALTIPTAIIFRFFPTVGEEYRDIKTAMRMRGVGGIRQPIRMLEYRLVPLMVSVVSIGNELSRSAVTRALGAKRKRTSVCEIKFRIIDGAVIVLLVACAWIVLIGKVW